MNIVMCPNCRTRVIPTATGLCPSCQKIIPAAVSPSASTNPFVDGPIEAASVYAGSAENLNPYASPSVIESERAKSNPLLVPAIVLLVGSIPWFLMVVFVAGTQMFAKGLLARLPDPEAVGEILACFLMGLMPVATIAGAMSMINRQSKQTAWAGALVALIPVCGPCYGLLMPFAIWAIVVMCRDDVSREFRSK